MGTSGSPSVVSTLDQPWRARKTRGERLQKQQRASPQLPAGTGPATLQAPSPASNFRLVNPHGDPRVSGGGRQKEL